MDKDSIYELQKVNCNCNDCGYMVRNMELYNESLTRHQKWQQDYFNGLKNRMVANGNWWRVRKNNLEKFDSLLTDADNMKFQFDKSFVTISYGQCSKLDFPVSFIPNVIQLDTQVCFVHRKDIVK